MKNKSWIGILVSVAFLFFAFRKTDWNELKHVFIIADYIYVIPAVLLNIFSIACRSARWRYLLKPVKSIRFIPLFSATTIGIMANNLLPARLGEFVRAYAIGKMESISKSASFATIVIERIIDGITLLFFLFCILLLYHLRYPAWVRNVILLAALFYAVATIFIVLLRFRTDWAIRLSSFVIRPFPMGLRDRSERILRSFATGLGVLKSTGDLTVTLLFSLLVWLPNVFIIHMLLVSFGIHLNIMISGFLLVLIGMGVMIPSAPGYIGTIQFISIAILALFGVDRDHALSFSLVYHACMFVPQVVVGLVFLFREGLSFSEIRSSADKIKSEGVS